MEEKIGSCDLCHVYHDVVVRHVNLFVMGSEGITICHECEMMLVNCVHNMMSLGARSKMARFHIGKHIGKIKEIG